MAAPTITSFAPASGPINKLVTVTGTNFIATPALNSVYFGADPNAVTPITATTTVLTLRVPVTALSGAITVSNSNGTGVSSTSFTVTVGSGASIAPDDYTGTSDNAALTPGGLLPYLRALLKDSADDISQLGLVNPTWTDASLYRYLELARGEYSRQRPKRAHSLTTTVSGQQFYSSPAGTLGNVDEVMWAPAGYDLDQISALAAALADGPGILWGGGVPVVGRVYFDSPASIRVWSIIREAWRQTFGGHWQPDTGGFNLIPTPTENGLNVLVFYRTEQTWSDIPWQHRKFILSNALLSAIEGITTQIAVTGAVSGQSLSLGLRALVQYIQTKYSQDLSIREPGVTAGRS